jgi:hypothetical protein
MVVARRAPIVPEPDRIRRIRGSFAWLDHRLLREGHLERMTLTDLAVYVFLVLVADRTGTSFYRKDTACRKLGIDWGQFEESKARLLERIQRKELADIDFPEQDLDRYDNQEKE